MSSDAVGWVWINSPFKGTTLLVHLAIGDVVNDAHDNEFWMTNERLAAKCRCGRSALIAALNALVETDYLEVLEDGESDPRRRGRGKPTRYRFLKPVSTRNPDTSSHGNGERSKPGSARSKPESARSASVKRAKSGTTHIPNKKEELKEPAADAKAPTADAETLPGIEPPRKSLRERDPTVAVAHKLAERVFANRRKKPLATFLNVRKRAVECLEAGWSVEEIEAVMMQPDCVFTNPGIQTQAAMMNNRSGRESPLEQVARITGYGRSADAGSRSDAGRGTDPLGLAEENPRRDRPRLEGTPRPPERRAGDGGGA